LNAKKDKTMFVSTTCVTKWKAPNDYVRTACGVVLSLRHSCVAIAACRLL